MNVKTTTISATASLLMVTEVLTAQLTVQASDNSLVEHAWFLQETRSVPAQRRAVANMGSGMLNTGPTTPSIADRWSRAARTSRSVNTASGKGPRLNYGR